MEMLLTPEQAAERLQLSTFSVRAHLREGKLRGIKRGRAWRIPESALLESSSARGEGVSPLSRALSMVKERDAAKGTKRTRTPGTDDAASELRALREERTV